MIEIKELINILIILLGLKLVLEKWQPPVQVSLQSLIVLVAGACLGWFLMPTKEGLVNGLIAGTLAMWGKQIFAGIRDLEDGNKVELTKENKGA